MKTRILFTATAIILLLNSFNSSAQRFEADDNVISLGLGLGSSIGYAGSSQTPAISVQYEHGQWVAGGPGVISLGAYIGYKSFSYDGVYPGFTYSQKWNYTIIGVRSAYHYNGFDAKNLDVYGGAMLSYNMLSYDYHSSDPKYDYLYKGNYDGGIGITFYVGGRYFFSDNLAGFLELGYGISFATVGIAFKL
jgi:hypothetical protein